MKTTEAPPISYTRAGAIAATGLPPRTIDHAIATGELPVIRSGKRKFIVMAEDLKAWLRRCRETGIPSPTLSQEDRERLAEMNRRRSGQSAPSQRDESVTKT